MDTESWATPPHDTLRKFQLDLPGWLPSVVTYRSGSPNTGVMVMSTRELGGATTWAV